MRAKRCRLSPVESLEQRRLLSTYHVSPLGDDLAAGTADQPWRTLQHAADTVTWGDTVSVAAGHYAGFTFKAPRLAEGDRPRAIAFLAQEGAVIDQAADAAGNGIVLMSARNLSIHGFTIRGLSGSGILARQVADSRITGNRLVANGASAITARGCSKLVVEDNTIEQTAHGDGIALLGDTRAMVRGNRITGSQGSGIRVSSLPGGISAAGTLIEANTLSQNGADRSPAIHLQGVRGARIQNNLLYANRDTAVLLDSIARAGSTGNYVLHNTIVQRSTGWALRLRGASGDNRLFNNILSASRSASGSIAVSSESLRGLRSDYNIFSGETSSADGAHSVDVSGWQAGTGRDRHSRIARPASLFVNPDAANYRLLRTSPALDAGLRLSIGPAEDLDADRRLRGKAPDAGAFERDGTPLRASILSIKTTPDNPVDRIAIAFNKPASGLTLSDLRLTNGGGNLLTGAQALTRIDDRHYVLSNLAGITEAGGTYTLRILAKGSGIIDRVGNLLGRDAASSFAINHTPQADAGTGRTVAVGASILFNGSSSFDPDGDTLNFSWEFGDGETAAGAAVSHVYDTEGEYTATLTVSDGKLSSTASVLVSVGAGAELVNDGPAAEGDPVTLLFSNALDPNGENASPDLTWSFDLDNDGTIDVVSDGPSYEAVFANDGTYTVRLRVSDNAGAFTDYFTEVVIENAPPLAVFSARAPQDGGDALVLFTEQMDPSPADAAAGFTYSYDFDSDGVFDIVNTASASAVVPPSYLATPGGHAIRGRIADRDGDFTEYTANLVIAAPGAPSASLIASDIIAEGGSSQSLIVTYASTGSIDVNSIDSNDLLVTGPSGFVQIATLVSVDDVVAGPSRTAIYRLDAPGGAWSWNDNGAYTVLLRSEQVFDLNGVAAAAGQLGAFQINISTVAGGAPQYLLTPTLLASAQQKAIANTPQWQAFRRRLDGELLRVTPGTYQGGSLTWAGDFALAYRVLKDSDPEAAARYADKAIAVLRSALQNNLKGNWGTRMLLGVGDGQTARFTLPHDNISPATFKVWITPVKTKTIVRGSTPNAQDAVESYSHFLRVWDDQGEYVEGVDWRKNTSYRDDMLDWSLPGREPAAGASYYVSTTSAAGSSAQLLVGGWTLQGSELVLATPPSSDSAVFVEYQYGAFSQGEAGLGYQQTSDGQGGFNNVLIDNGYSSRYLKYLPIALDWLWDYRGLSAQLRAESVNILVRWSDHLRDRGYKANSPGSNYGAGHYAFRVATAIALRDRSPEGPRMAAEMQAYRSQYLLPLFQEPAGGTGTLTGGHWAEGWNYGPLSIRNIVTAGMALEAVGLADIYPERAWSGEVIEALLSQQPTQRTIYDGGDGYAWPLPFPDKTLLTDLAQAAADAKAASYANWAIQNYSGTPLAGWEDLLYRDPQAQAGSWSDSLALARLAQGTGLAVARKDWSYNSTWMSFQSGNLVAADHQPYAQGQLTIQRGADALLVNAAAVSGLQGLRKSQYGNLVLVDDGGAGEQTYRYSQGVWYGDPGCLMSRFENESGYTYMQGDYAAAYRKNYSGSNPAQELVRSVFYVREADYIIVYDRVGTTQPTHLKQLQWHFNAAPAVDGNSWSVTAGKSTILGATYSSTPITTASALLTVSGSPIHQISVNNAEPATSIRYVTALQVTSADAAAAAPSTRVLSSDGLLEGVQMGNYLVLFGKDGIVNGPAAYSFTQAAGALLTHYITDLAPGMRYTLAGAEQASVTASDQGVISFTTRGLGDLQSVSITPMAS